MCWQLLKRDITIQEPGTGAGAAHNSNAGIATLYERREVVENSDQKLLPPRNCCVTEYTDFIVK